METELLQNRTVKAGACVVSGVVVTYAVLAIVRKALDGVARYATAVVSGSAFGSGAFYVQDRVGREGEAQSPPTAAQGAQGSQEISSKTEESKAPESLPFSLPGERLFSAKYSIKQAGRRKACQVIGEVDLASRWSLERLDAREVRVLVGNKGLYAVRCAPAALEGKPQVCNLAFPSQSIELPISPKGDDGGLVVVEGLSRPSELACFGDDAIAICNFETESAELYHLPKELRRAAQRELFRSPSGGYYVLARSPKRDGNRFYYGKLSKEQTTLQMVLLGAEEPVTRACVRFAGSHSLGKKSRFRRYLMARDALGAIYALPQGPSDASQEVFREAVGACVGSLFITPDSEGLALKRLSTGAVKCTIKQAGFTGVAELKCDGKTLGVAWNADGEVLLIDPAKPASECRVRRLKTKLSLRNPHFLGLEDNAILAIREGRALYLVDAGAGTTVTKIPIRRGSCVNLQETSFGPVLVELSGNRAIAKAIGAKSGDITVDKFVLVAPSPAT